MKLHKLILSVALFLLALSLSGCGGGGSDAPAPTAAPTYPLQAAFREMTLAGGTDNFEVSGWCTGTATITTSAAVPASFEGVAGYQTVLSASVELVSCSSGTTGTFDATVTQYFDANFSPIGESSADSYSAFDGTRLAMPASVKVGDAGELGSIVSYTDSTKTVVNGRSQSSYEVQADAPGTALVVLITRGYDTSNQLIDTTYSRYRIGSNAGLSLLSMETVYSDPQIQPSLFTKL